MVYPWYLLNILYYWHHWLIPSFATLSAFFIYFLHFLLICLMITMIFELADLGCPQRSSNRPLPIET